MRGFRKFSTHLTKCHACHGICTLSPRDAALPIGFAKNTKHDTSKVLRVPRQMTTRPKCCACHENCDASSENVAKVLCLPHTTIFDTLQNTSECHEVPRLPRETKQRHMWTSKSDPFCRTYHKHGHSDLARTVADGCKRLRTVAKGCEHKRNVEQTHSPPEWNGNPYYAFGKTAMILQEHYWSTLLPAWPFLQAGNMFLVNGTIAVTGNFGVK